MTETPKISTLFSVRVPVLSKQIFLTLPHSCNFKLSMTSMSSFCILILAKWDTVESMKNNPGETQSPIISSDLKKLSLKPKVSLETDLYSCKIAIKKNKLEFKII